MEVSLLIADVIFVLIGALIIWRCARNGFIKCLFKFIRTILALTLAGILVTPVAPIVAENFIEEPVYDYVHEEVNAIYENAEDDFEIQEIIDSLPDVLKSEDMEEDLNDIDATGEELVESISKEISDPIVSVISTVISFIALFIILFIVLSIVMALLNSLIEKIKVIHLANTILGLVWGVLVALIVWTIISAVALLFFDLENSIAIRLFAEANVLENLGILDLLEDLLMSAF